jgi:NAD(P)-dependent dehydrogenase (short-subunit alcohol dehydrogenase family)
VPGVGRGSLPTAPTEDGPERSGMETAMARLDGKVAVITGAGSGIGRVAASLFAAEGAQVVVADVAADQAESAVAEIVGAGGSATAVTVDVSDESQVTAMVATAVRTYGGLHVLFNNAGIFPDDDGGILDTPPETWQKVMEVNLKGVWLGCRAGVPAMLDSGGGSIVNVASFVALMGAATAQMAYTASKGGVLAMTRELAVEYARRGIRANSICPGPIETPLLAELLADPGRRQRRLVHIPVGRFGRPEEIAKAALFLASDDASFVTGSALVVDGGITAAYVTPE